jgi:hypothetical protein
VSAEEARFSTIFEILDRGTSPLGNITKALDGAQMATSKLTGMLRPLNMLLGAIGAGLSFDKMLDIGSAYENQSIKMAQTAKLMGMGGETFADAMVTAGQMIKQVNVAAAALPGEAEDYTTALEMSGFTVQQATGDYQKTFNLIKDITAITISNQRSAAEGASQMNKMLNADRGLLELQNDYSTKLIQNMRAIPGYANLTTSAFNNLKLEERVKLVEKLAGTFKDMIDASSGTLDAIKGASMTIFKELTRQATAPLFDGWKHSLAAVNKLLMNADGTLTPLSERIVFIGNVLSEKVVTAVNSISKMDLSEIGTLVGGLASMGAGGAGIGAIFSPLIVFGQTLGKLAEDVEFTSAVFDSINGVLHGLEPVTGMLAGWLDRTSGLLADVATGVLPSFLDMLDRIVPAAVWLAQVISDMGRRIWEQITPTLDALWVQLSIFFKGVGDFVVPLLKGLGMTLWAVWEVIDGPLIGSVRAVIRIFGQLFEWVGKFLSWAGEQLAWAINEIGDPLESQAKGSERKSFLDEMIAMFTAPSGGNAKGIAPPKAPDKKPPAPVQDFRFSRFQIDQKFEEGFDPDRIAVAFANDLGKIGEQRSQSGFAPLFSVGI